MDQYIKELEARIIKLERDGERTDKKLRDYEMKLRKLNALILQFRKK